MSRHSEQLRSVLRFLCRLWDPWRRSREADDSRGDCTVYCRQERRLWIMFDSSLLRWVSASHAHPVLFSYLVNDSGVCCLLQRLPRPPTGSTHETEQPLLPSVLLSIKTSLALVSCVWLYLNENVRWELGDKKKQVNKQGRIGFFFSLRQPVVPNA